jgi:Fe2+ or Zn2+ uptake regulation protein
VLSEQARRLLSVRSNHTVAHPDRCDEKRELKADVTTPRAGSTERVLRALYELHDPRRLFVRVRLGTLAKMTGLSPPTIRTTLVALVDRGFVSKVGYDTYRLGPKTT